MAPSLPGGCPLSLPPLPHREHRGSRSFSFPAVPQWRFPGARHTMGCCSMSLCAHPCGFRSPLCPGVVHPALCHCPSDTIPPFTNAFCYLLRPLPLPVVALSSSWTLLERWTLFIRRACLVSDGSGLTPTGGALVTSCSCDVLAPSDPASSFVQVSHSHLESKMRFSDNPGRFPGCYYSKPRAL